MFPNRLLFYKTSKNNLQKLFLELFLKIVTKRGLNFLSITFGILDV